MYYCNRFFTFTLTSLLLQVAEKNHVCFSGLYSAVDTIGQSIINVFHLLKNSW